MLYRFQVRRNQRFLAPARELTRIFDFTWVEPVFCVPKISSDCGCQSGGGGGVLNKVLYGEAPLRGPTPYHFIYHFGKKGTPFIDILLKKGTLLTYLF